VTSKLAERGRAVHPDLILNTIARIRTLDVPPQCVVGNGAMGFAEGYAVAAAKSGPTISVRNEVNRQAMTNYLNFNTPQTWEANKTAHDIRVRADKKTEWDAFKPEWMSPDGSGIMPGHPLFDRTNSAAEQGGVGLLASVHRLQGRNGAFPSPAPPSPVHVLSL
jgi:hypothetical protein